MFRGYPIFFFFIVCAACTAPRPRHVNSTLEERHLRGRIKTLEETEYAADSAAIRITRVVIDTFDSAGLLIRERNYYNDSHITYPDSEIDILYCHYDAAGHRTMDVSYVFDSPALQQNFVNHYYYDSLGGLREEDAFDGRCKYTFSHDERGRVKERVERDLSYNYSVYHRFTYGPNGDVITERCSLKSDDKENVDRVLWQIRYSYDTLGNVVCTKKYGSDSTHATVHHKVYQYDAAHNWVKRVDSELNPTGGATRVIRYY
jgi:hypothetical protein